MPTLSSKNIKEGIIELTILVPMEEIEPHLEHAAKELQQSSPLPGFRPGKAPFETAKKAFGDMAILEAALKHAVPISYAAIIEQERLKTIGDPEIQVTKLTPNDPVEFTAKTALLPKVQLGDYKSIRVTKKEITVENREIDELLTELQDMRASQTLVNRAAAKKDRVIVDMNISRDKVPLEGGQTKNHALDLFRPYVIPGFTDQMIGVKAGDNKKFSLPFPKDHYDKNLAGKNVEYDITVKGVYEYKRPELTDEFAKTVGKFSSLDELKNQLKNNLTQMHETRETQRLEREIINKLIEQTTFGDIPELLTKAEIHKMIWRLKEQVEREGGSWEDYLSHLGENIDKLTKDWLPEALIRVKTSLLIRSIAEAENIKVEPEDINKERDTILTHYQGDDNEKIRDEIKNKGYDPHLKHLILTRKVMKYMKSIATQTRTEN